MLVCYTKANSFIVLHEFCMGVSLSQEVYVQNPITSNKK